MGKSCCKGAKKAAAQASPCHSKPAGGGKDECPLTRFSHMIENCYEYATAAKAAGRPVVGIMCEFTPRELIMAAGGVPHHALQPHDRELLRVRHGRQGRGPPHHRHPV